MFFKEADETSSSPPAHVRWNPRSEELCNISRYFDENSVGHPLPSRREQESSNLTGGIQQTAKHCKVGEKSEVICSNPRLTS